MIRRAVLFPLVFFAWQIGASPVLQAPDFLGKDSPVDKSTATPLGGVGKTSATGKSMTGWVPSGSLGKARIQHTTTLLTSGKVLVVGGAGGEGYLNSAELYDPILGRWESTAELATARSRHTATLMPSGDVFIVGGGNGALLSSVECFDPGARTWSTVNPLGTARENHTATLLPDGRLLVVGGMSGLGGALASAEYYDPAPEVLDWITTAGMATPRSGHTASYLPDQGKVLVVGGNSGGTLATVELYDPIVGESWTSAEDLNTARENHTATVLADGKVLVVGGTNGGALDSTEIYDPNDNSWTEVGPLLIPRSQHTATLLPSGHVLVAGGNNAGTLASAELYDPDTQSWTLMDSLRTKRENHTSLLLPDGSVLVVGGSSGGFAASTELFRLEAATWLATGSLGFARFGHTATLLPTGEVLITGDASVGALPSAELYNPQNGTWRSTGTPLRNRAGHTATLLPSGKVLVAGGNDSTGFVAIAELYNPVTGFWATTGALQVPRSGHTATLLPSGKVLVAGGGSTTNPDLVEAELYDPATGTWTLTGSLETPRVLHTATLLPSGKVLVAGGQRSFFSDSNSSAELYDFMTETWSPTGRLITARSTHTATLLPSGKVLVAGGGAASDSLADAELYDPQTGTWTATASLAASRGFHTATLLPSGRVLVTGGAASLTLAGTEIYEPLTGTWSSVDALIDARTNHTATLLPSGAVLVAGGRFRASSEIYRDAISQERRPVISAVSPALRYDTPVNVTGTDFGGGPEASDGGSFSNAAVNYPLIHLRSVENQQMFWLAYASVDYFSQNPMTLTMQTLPIGFEPGWYAVGVVRAGVASLSEIVEMQCSLEITRQPVDRTVPIGTSATFEIGTNGGRFFQWMKDGVPIAGATGPSYTTPPVSAPDSGTPYSVRVMTGCMTEDSQTVTLSIHDEEPPLVELKTPNGGEYWLLSGDDEPRTEIVTWTMSDNVRICRVEARLMFSNDGGMTYQSVPANGGVLGAEGPGGTCRFGEQPQMTSVTYQVPTAPPSGSAGSLYKVEVEVTDHVGLVTTVPSTNPFFIVEPNPDSVRTLILAHLPRMEARMGITPQESEALELKLQDLAGHPRVQGLVVDLSTVTSLTPLYEAWDAMPADGEKANDVLFGTGGLHEYLRTKVLSIYTSTEYLVLVGDDRIIPFARISDRTSLLESSYAVDVAGSDLTASGTTVGQALAGDQFLSDDLLAVRDPIAVPLTSDQISRGAFLPTLAIGRLVENPDEIITSIATYISQDGVLDLASLDAETGHKVLVTGYDFLIDLGRKIRRRWKDAFGVPEPHDDNALAPVDGQLITPTWGEPTVPERRLTLRTHLSGNGGERYGVANLNGHANHYSEGVPGNDVADIQGLSGSEIYGPHACGTDPPLDLAGSVVYALGCHGGLPVSGSCISDADHSLDLPQTFLARGIVAYVANTGYGWGLLDGIGYSERLVEIMTEEMTAGGTVVVGEVVRRAKLRYFLDTPRLDQYDEKTVQQWTLFGLPMYAVRTGIGSGSASKDLTSWSPGPRPEVGSEYQQLGAVAVERHLGDAKSSLPPYLTQLNVHFDFSAPGVFIKYNALGEVIEDPSPGCTHPDGCYYTLNGLVERGTGTADLPIQPYIVYDSRLSGTSQHGVLWMGGTYQEETGWIPVVAELVSNDGSLSNHGSTPRLAKPKTRIRQRRPPVDDTSCSAADTELSTLVVVAGEALKEQDSDLTFTIERIFRATDVEILYFNDQGGGGNCDRTAPELGPKPFGDAYHEVSGTRIEWAVTASDVAGVWRAVVVYDLGPDDQGHGQWRPLELADDGTGTWRGSVTVPEAPRLTYVLQVVDHHGNVSWLDYEAVEPPESDAPLDLPLPVDVNIPETVAGLTLDLSDDPDPVVAQGFLTYTIAVENLGPAEATWVTVTDVLPPGVTFLGTSTSWNCNHDAGTVTCTLEILPVGPAPLLTIFLNAPPTSGTLSNQASVTAFEADLVTGDNSDLEQTFVTSGADLRISKSDGGATAVAGHPLTYTLAAANNGVEDVFGATVTDVFPTELVGVTWSCVAAPGSSCTANGSGDISDSVDLLSGGMVIYTATGTIVPDTFETIENNATITTPAGIVDPDSSNNAASVSTPVENPNYIFADGFESGDFSRWSAAVP